MFDELPVKNVEMVFVY